MKRGSLFLMILILGLSRPAWADDVSIEASVNQTQVSMDEQLMFFVTVKGSIANVPTPQLPALSTFEAYSTGRSQNVSITNGQMSSSVQFTYVLVPKAPGRFTIPPISITVGGKTLSTQSLIVEVSPGHAKSATPPTPTTGEPVVGEGVILRAHVDKKKAVVQEQVTLTVQFLRRVRFLSRPSYTPPETTGWMSYDLKPTEYTTTIHGLGFSVTEFKYALFPTSSGKLNIGPAVVQCSVENFQADPFDAFFQNFFQAGQTKTLKTNPITVEVSPLPESGKPSGFSGSVGRYELTAGIDKQTVTAGEPVTLTIDIKGEGNIKTIGEPNLTPPPAFRRYETITSLNTQSSRGWITGSKAFKTVLVPQEAGSFSIGPVNFSYFDPSRKKYISLRSNALFLSALPGATRPQSPLLPGLEPRIGEVRLLKKDIRYQKPILPGPSNEEEPLKLRALGALNGLPLLLLGGSGWIYFKRERELRDPDRARGRRALSLAGRSMKKALEFIDEADPARYLGVLSSVVTGYLADQLVLSRSGLSLEETIHELKTRGVQDETLQNLKKIWEDTDRGRFAPIVMTTLEKREIHRRAVTLLDELEKQLRLVSPKLQRSEGG